MSESPWFFHAPLPADGGDVWISKEEARHVAGARRLRGGDEVTFMDGHGGVARGELTDERDRTDALRVQLQATVVRPRVGRRVVIATALPKGDRAATLLEAMGPLGVEEVVALECDFSVAGLTEHQRTRSERILQEGCKQSRMPWVPGLSGPMRPVDAMQRSALEGSVAVLLDPNGAALSEVLRDPSTRTDPVAALAAPVWVFIGPEGGFSPTEKEALVRAGAVSARLACGILRVELAATVAATLARGVGEWSVPGSNR